MEKFVVFLGEAFIIETNGKAIDVFGRVEIRGMITHIIHHNGGNKIIGKEYSFPFECSHYGPQAIEYIFKKFINTISFKPY